MTPGQPAGFRARIGANSRGDALLRDPPRDELQRAAGDRAGRPLQSVSGSPWPMGVNGEPR